MMEFDKYVTTELKEIVEKESEKRLVSNRKSKKALKHTAVSGRMTRILYRIKVLQKRIKDDTYDPNFPQDRNIKDKHHQRKKLLRKINKIKFKTAYNDANRNKFRLHYTRYADDWIIISNFPREFAERIKKKIEIWLRENLRATLSMEKTKITLLTKEPARFLGFELRVPRGRRMGKKKLKDGTNVQRRSAGWDVLSYPDNDRLINRLHMKGYAKKDGRPKALPWLSTLEAFTIIEKYNSVMRGFANYYAEFISNKSRLYRWLYVIKYFCLKTLAQKYRTKIAKLFKKYLVGNHITISVTNVLNHKTEQGNIETRTYQKSCKLLNEKECVEAALNLFSKDRIRNIYERLENGLPPIYPVIKKGRTPRIKDNNFIDRINFVNSRSKASLDMPCMICGSEEKVEMHHVRHVRKSKWSDIKKTDFYKHLMAIRLRKQLPVCRACHMVIHKGQYTGLGLAKLYDARIINPEQYIQKGNFEVPPWEDRLKRSGWDLINKK